MDVLVLSGSPKKRFSSSGFFSGILKAMLAGCHITEFSIRNTREHAEILNRMKEADAIILSVPLYVDGIPSHVLRFLREAERFCKENRCRGKLYVVSNAGFVEGRHNETHLEQYRCWCERAAVEWGGGLGIGGGVMLRVIFYVLLVDIGQFLVGMALNIAKSGALLSDGMLFSLLRGAFVWLFLSSGMLVCSWLLSRSVKRGVASSNLYTRVMVPSFLFLIVADLFMVLMALLKGKLPFSLSKKDTYADEK